MNWDALGAVAELASAIGVVVTLIYLSLQIRQNVRALRGQSYDERTRALREISMHFAREDWFWVVVSKIQSALVTELPLTQIRASRGEWESAIAELSREERTRFSAAMRLLFDHYSNMFFKHEQGLLDETSFENIRRAVSIAAPLWLALGFASSLYAANDFTRFVREVGNASTQGVT